LYELQQIDSRIGHLLAERARLNDGSVLRAQLEKLKTSLEQNEQELRSLEGTYEDKQLELQSVEQKIKEDEEKLYQGLITKPKEVENLQLELESLADRQDSLETEVLELMEKLDPLRETVAQQRKQVAALDKELTAVVTAFEAEVKDIDAELEQLQAEREKRAATIIPAILNRYDRIREQADNVGIVRVTGKVCTGCNVALTAFILRQLQEMREVQYCENCHRILYWTGEARKPITAERFGIEVSPEEWEEQMTASDFRRGRTLYKKDEKDGKLH